MCIRDSSNTVLGISLTSSSVTINGLGIDDNDNIYISGYTSSAGYPNYVKKVTSTGTVDSSCLLYTSRCV